MTSNYSGEDFPCSFYSDITIAKHLVREDERQIASLEKHIYIQLYSAEEGLYQARQTLTENCFSYYCILLKISRCILAENYHGITLDAAIVNAVNQDHIAIAAVLLRFGANVHLTEYSTNSGLLHSCKSAEMVDLLVLFGADLKQKTLSGKSALHNAANTSTAEALIRHGLSINLRDNTGGTVLHYASSLCTAQYFVRMGVEINAVNRTGFSAIHMLVAYGNWETVLMLLTAGADHTIRGRDGMQPGALAYAVKGLLMCRFLENDPATAREIRRIDYTLTVLNKWQALCKCNHPLSRLRLLIMEDYSMQALARVCSKPLDALGTCFNVKLPDDIVKLIVFEYLGPFARIRDNRSVLIQRGRVVYPAPTNTVVKGGSQSNSSHEHRYFIVFSFLLIFFTIVLIFYFQQINALGFLRSLGSLRI